MRHAPALLLLLASCAPPLHKGREEFFEGLYWLRSSPPEAQIHLEQAAARMEEALASGDLDLPKTATALSIRARALIELDRHAEAAAAVERSLPGFDTDLRYEGDNVGLALLRAYHTPNLDRAYARLVRAEREAGTMKARIHLAWHEVRFLEKMGMPQARQEAIRLCEQHAGRLDFDEIKTRLTAPAE